MKAPTDQPPTQTKVRALLAARMVTSEDASDNSCSRSISDLIGMHALAYGHTSPHAQDLMRRQLQDGVFEERPALILGDFVAVHDAFHNQYPECKVSFESFCQALPWNVLETPRVAVADSNIRRQMSDGRCQTAIACAQAVRMASRGGGGGGARSWALRQSA